MNKPPIFAERSKITRVERDELTEEQGLPPVVARMVVEIRSDGSRTVARGALEDLQNGERVSLQADAATPVALVAQLSKSLLSIPALTRGLTESAAKELAQMQLNKIKDKVDDLVARSPLGRLKPLSHFKPLDRLKKKHRSGE